MIQSNDNQELVMKLHPRRGFTLIELLVVIAIIGILASFITASMGESRAQARDAERLNDVKQLQVALELFYNRNGAYPTSLDQLLAANNDQNTDYMPALPADPKTGDAYEYSGGDNDYAVRATSDDGSMKCRVATNGSSELTDDDTVDCPFH